MKEQISKILNINQELIQEVNFIYEFDVLQILFNNIKKDNLKKLIEEKELDLLAYCLLVEEIENINLKLNINFKTNKLSLINIDNDLFINNETILILNIVQQLYNNENNIFNELKVFYNEQKELNKQKYKTQYNSEIINEFLISKVYEFKTKNTIIGLNENVSKIELLEKKNNLYVLKLTNEETSFTETFNEIYINDLIKIDYTYYLKTEEIKELLNTKPKIKLDKKFSVFAIDEFLYSDNFEILEVLENNKYKMKTQMENKEITSIVELGQFYFLLNQNYKIIE